MPVTRGAVWLAKVIGECRSGKSLFPLYRRDCGADQKSIEVRSARSRANSPWTVDRQTHMSSNRRVLIVEDGPSVREMLAEHLSTRGYEVARADRASSPMRRVGAMSASENLERSEWVVSGQLSPGT